MPDPAEGGRAGAWMRHILVFGLLLALFLLLIAPNVSPEPYGYDEADYMYAASLGFAANYTDAPSMPIEDFVRVGLRGSGRQALSQHIRSGDDVVFYRHFHGPLLYYFLIPISRLGLNERLVRTSLLAIPCASLAVIYFGCFWLLREPDASLAALLASTLFLASHSVIWSTEIAPHQLFALCSLACLVLLLKAVATGRRAYWYASVVVSALAFCTLEVAFVLILTVAICGFWERRRWQGDGRFVVKSAGAFLATILAIWPAAILRMSFVKGYAVMAYHSVMRESSWGQEGFIETWRARLFESPLEWTLIILALLFLFQRKASDAPRFYPIAMFAGLMLVATLGVHTSTPRYSLVFLPALDLLAGLTLIPYCGSLRRPASLAVVALAVAGLYGIAWVQVVRKPHNSNPRSAAVLTYIHQNSLEDKAVLAPQADLPSLHYYFPAMRLRGYFGREPSASEQAGYAAVAILR